MTFLKCVVGLAMAETDEQFKDFTLRNHTSPSYIHEKEFHSRNELLGNQTMVLRPLQIIQEKCKRTTAALADRPYQRQNNWTIRAKAGPLSPEKASGGFLLSEGLGATPRHTGGRLILPYPECRLVWAREMGRCRHHYANTLVMGIRAYSKYKAK